MLFVDVIADSRSVETTLIRTFSQPNRGFITRITYLAHLPVTSSRCSQYTACHRCELVAVHTLRRRECLRRASSLKVLVHLLNIVTDEYYIICLIYFKHRIDKVCERPETNIM